MGGAEGTGGEDFVVEMGIGLEVGTFCGLCLVCVGCDFDFFFGFFSLFFFLFSLNSWIYSFRLRGPAKCTPDWS